MDFSYTVSYSKARKKLKDTVALYRVILSESEDEQKDFVSYLLYSMQQQASKATEKTTLQRPPCALHQRLFVPLPPPWAE